MFPEFNIRYLNGRSGKQLIKMINVQPNKHSFAIVKRTSIDQIHGPIFYATILSIWVCALSLKFVYILILKITAEFFSTQLSTTVDESSLLRPSG